MEKYMLWNGTEVTKTDITRAIADGKARIIHSYNADGKVVKSLALNGMDIDTRGLCYSIYDEVWTRKPNFFEEAFLVSQYSSQKMN